MKTTKLESILINLGLTENEANVYLASLSLGPATILKISQAGNIKRTTVYSVIESLKKKGLMRIELKGWKKLYTAENPEKLEFILEEKKNQLASSLPEFMSLYNLKGGESFIKYYEGLQAVKSVYESLLRDIRPHEDYMIVSDQSKWQELDPKYFLKFLERRAKLNINIRLLLQDSEVARKVQKIQATYNEKIKILPKGTSLVTNLVVIPKRVVIHQLTPPIMAMVIENKSIIKMHQQFFEIMWQSIK